MDELDIIFNYISSEINITNKDVCMFIEKLIQKPSFRLQGLEQWEYWLKERIKLQKSLGKRVQRIPDKLTMNKEVPWALKHERKLLDEALSNNVHVFDKYRGHPNFWLSIENVSGKKHKESITKHMYPGTIDFSVYRSSTTSFGYFGKPRKLDKEKELTGEYRQMEKLKKWHKNRAVKKSKLEAEVNIKEIEPFIPVIDKLIVEGKGLEKKISAKVKIPKIVITEPAKEKHKNFGWWINDSNPHSVSPPILKIGDDIITPGIKTSKFLWNLSFCYQSKSKEKKLNLKKLKIMNKGSTVVHYKWKKIPTYINKKLPFQFIHNDEPKFFFDITDGLILPGKKVTLLFLFKTSLAGPFKEVWQLITRPPVHQSPLLLVLNGISLKETTKSIIRARNIDKYIQQCRQNANLAFKINKQKQAQYKKQSEKIIKYNEMFTEREKFQYNNPTLYYNMHEINLLKTIYFRVTRSFWNYSLKDLHEAICSMFDEEQREKYLRTYADAYRSLQKPPVFDHVMNNRYNGVYELLGRFVNEMETVFIALEFVFNFKPLPRVDMLYENMEPAIPSVLEDVECLEDVEEEEEVAAFDTLIKDFFIKEQGIDTITYKSKTKDISDDDDDDGNGSGDRDFEEEGGEEEEEEEEELMEEEECDVEEEESDEELEVEEEESTGKLEEEDDDGEEEADEETEGDTGEEADEDDKEVSEDQEEEEEDDENEEDSSEDEEERDRGSSEDEDSEEGLEHAESKFDMSRTDLIRKREKDEAEILGVYKKINDPDSYLCHKKFINFIGLKDLQQKIKHKVCKNRIKFRHILIEQCRNLLAETVDKISGFLETTQLIEDDVQCVENPLEATHPYY